MEITLVDSNILSDNSVNTDKIQDGGITNSKISGTVNIVGTKFNLTLEVQQTF